MSDTTSKDDELYKEVEAFESYRIEIYRQLKNETISAEMAFRLVKTRRKEHLEFIKQYGIQERLDELSNIWFKSSAPAEYSSIKTDISKGGQTLGERAWDLQHELTAFKAQQGKE